MSFIRWDSLKDKTLAEKFRYLIEIFKDIAAAIREKGVPTVDQPVDKYGDLIRQIQGGGRSASILGINKEQINTENINLAYTSDTRLTIPGAEYSTVIYGIRGERFNIYRDTTPLQSFTKIAYGVERYQISDIEEIT